MNLEIALEKAGRLRAALAAEVESARRERELLRKLDARALFERAAQRGQFLSDVAALERELTAALESAARALGIEEVTLSHIRERAPREGEALARTLSEVRSLAGALHEIDRLNLQLAGRALACMRGDLEALSPPPRAYDRRGARFAAPALALVSSKG